MVIVNETTKHSLENVENYAFLSMFACSVMSGRVEDEDKAISDRR